MKYTCEYTSHGLRKKHQLPTPYAFENYAETMRTCTRISAFRVTRTHLVDRLVHRRNRESIIIEIISSMARKYQVGDLRTEREQLSNETHRCYHFAGPKSLISYWELNLCFIGTWNFEGLQK